MLKEEEIKRRGFNLLVERRSKLVCLWVARMRRQADRYGWNIWGDEMRRRESGSGRWIWKKENGGRSLGK